MKKIKEKGLILICSAVALFLGITLTACSFGNKSSIDKGPGSSSQESEKIIEVVEQSSEYFVDEKYMVHFKIVGNNETHYLNDFKISLTENTCEANYYWEDTDGDKSSELYIFANKEGTVDFAISWKNYHSKITTFSFNMIKVSTAEDLIALANTSKKVKLANDIDLFDYDSWAPIEGFSGVLDGDGHTIYNLTINSINDENLGLFGIFGGTVENLVIDNAQISSRGDIGKAGIFCGTNSGTINNVSVDGIISCSYYDNVGGVVGFNNNGIITRCENGADVAGNDNVGGIAGNCSVNGNNRADKNINKGKIGGNDNVGGVFGYLTSPVIKTDQNFEYQLSENLNENVVTGKNNVGGIVGHLVGASKYGYGYDGLGYFRFAVFTNKGEVQAAGDCVGGIVGYSERLSEITVSENSANITGGNYVGGYVGKANGTKIKVATNNNVITGKGYVGGIAGFAGNIESATNNGNIISTAIIVENGTSRSYVGGIAGYCTAINKSKNTVDISINNPGSYIGGLVGYLCINSNDQLNENENLGDIKGNDSVGGIVGYATMPIKQTDSNFTYSSSNNINNGSVRGKSEVGGIIGYLVGASKYGYGYDGLGYFDISLYENNGNVTSSGDNAGGLIGKATRLATLTVSTNNADVTGKNYVGGYVGHGSGANIKLANNNNKIEGKGYVGGIAGVAGKIENSINNGVINSIGVIIENNLSMSYVGGIAGYCNSLLNCTNNSDITVDTDGQYVGGIAGYILFNDNNMINENKNYGQIDGSQYTGGIAGCIRIEIVQTDNDYTRIVSLNENNGIISGNNYVGGIFGYSCGAEKYGYGYDGIGYIIVTECKNYSEVIGTSYVGGIVGGYSRLKTDENLMNTNTTIYGEKLGQ